MYSKETIEKFIDEYRFETGQVMVLFNIMEILAEINNNLTFITTNLEDGINFDDKLPEFF